MNERIQELAHEAGLPTYNPSDQPTKLEKFAMLLIRDCTQQVNCYEALNILEHFGIDKL